METSPSLAELQSFIFSVRGHQVMLDFDIAAFYEISSKRVNEKVRREKELFPPDFVFQLTQTEFEKLKLDDSRLNTQMPRFPSKFLPPLVFTELGVAMLATVLKNEKAKQMHVLIFRAFVQRRKSSNHLEKLENEIAELKNYIECQTELGKKQLSLFTDLTAEIKATFEPFTLKKVNSPTRRPLSFLNDLPSK